MKNAIAMFFFLFCLLLAACGGKAAAPSLAGTSWVLEQINGQPVLPTTVPTLSFGHAEQAGGNASCNSFGAAYHAGGGKLTFESLFATRMACLEPGVMEQETAYLAALESVAVYQIQNGKLILLDASGATALVFGPQDISLQGKTWRLTAFKDGQSLVSVLPDTEVSVVFQDEDFSGVSGCNRYQGMFQQNGQELTFGALVVTERYCSEPAGIMEQETAYLNMLSKVTRYTMDGNRLTLLDAGGQVMAEFTK